MAASPQADPHVLARHIRDGLALIQPTSCPTCRHREQRILERELRVKESRRRWAGRLIIGVLVVVLGMLAWYRFGDATALVSVQR